MKFSENLSVAPTTGAVVGTPVGLMFNGIPFDLLDVSDIAVRLDGTFYMTNLSDIYILEVLTGALTLVHTDAGQGLAGAIFSNNVPQEALFAYEVNSSDDIFRYDVDSGFTRTTIHADIIPSFNAGRR